MNTRIRAFIVGALGFAALGFSAASANSRPDFCDFDHDHRAHHADYYDYYAPDRYYRAGPYRPAGYGARYDRRDAYRGHVYRNARIVDRDVYPTRGRARIVVTEAWVRTRRGPRLICTVDARGPDARFVPYRRLERVAYRSCSPRARVNIRA